MKNKLVGTIVGSTLVIGGVAFTDAQIDPYVSKLDRFEISSVSTLEAAGENKIEVLKSKPEIRFKKWNGEVDLGVSYNKIQTTGNRAFLTNRVEWKGAKEELHAYPLSATSTMEDGGFEIEVVLNEKPLTNKFDFTIQGAENLDFFYQPELTAEETAEGASRPENVVGSYAVYHKTKANHRVGGTNYTTGKVFHIYRPKAFDKNGVEVWAELNYTNGTLSVTVPQKFLDDAVYPVKVDPTIGYTTIGSVTLSGTTATIYCSNQNTTTDTSGGNVSDINAYVRQTGGDVLMRAAIYLVSSSALQSPQSSEFDVDTSISWKQVSFSGPSLSASTAYYPCVFINGSGTNTYLFNRDTGVSGDSKLQNTTYPTWTDPATFSNSSFKYSIYATYTASAAAANSHYRLIFEE